MAHNTISEIEAMTLEEVQALKPEKMEVNGHDVYLVDLGGYFKYSALVFRNGKHLYYANDYEMHHGSKNREELKSWYRDTMSNKLYSDDMIANPIKDYHDGENKKYYLRNYYSLMCDDRVSAFNIIHNDEEEKAFEKKIEGMTFSRIGFFYTNDKGFCERLEELYRIAEESEKHTEDSYDYWFSAFKYEMYNHEYAINWTPDTDTLSAFVNIPYSVAVKFNDSYSMSLEELLDYLKFTDVKKRAYLDARSYVLRNSDY